MRLRFREGQKVLVRCAPKIFREGVVYKYIKNVGIYETYGVIYQDEEDKEYIGRFYDVHMMPLSL